jgi:hypothetical protein
MKALAVKGLTQINDANDPIQELNLKGEISIIEFETEELVKKCYDFIGTDIVECVHLASLGVTMWLDEEGKLKNNVRDCKERLNLWRRRKKYGLQ